MNNSHQTRQPKQLQQKKKKKLNILEKLHLFQIHGSLKDKQSSSSRVFEFFPRRLVFRLSDMIKRQDWKSDLTFLGFTQDGQFLLSYTVQYGYNDDPLIPNRHIYHLQWWLFVPYRALEKVREIRLFRDQEITEDILLAVCQWPTDNTKLLIYGSYRRSNDPEIGRWCYLTITSMPPLKPCSNCSALLAKDSESNIEEFVDEDYGWDSSQKLCLEHSFSVHTRYIRVPPFPAFNPYVNMKVDGLVIVNTGDNLIAISVRIQAKQKHWAQSPNPQVNQMQPLSVFCDDDLISLSDFMSPCHCSIGSPNDWTQNYLLDPTTKHTGTNLCIVCCKPVRWCGRQNKNDDIKNEFPTKWVGKPVVDEDCSFDEVVKNVTYHSGDCNTEKNGDVKCLSIQLDNAWQNDEVVPDIPLDETALKETTLIQHGYYRHCEKENISPKSGRVVVSSPKLPSPNVNRKSTEDRHNEGALAMPSVTESQSSGYSGSEINSDGAHKSGSCVAESVQYFGQWEENESNPSHFEDDSAGTEYHNVLSFEVSGVQCKPMKALNPDKLQNWMNSAVAIHHLTFDIEQFAHEMAQKICNEAGKKYLAFLDYDVQIIDVCEVSQLVIALVLMQVQAMVGQKGVAKELRSSVRRVFQTGFKFEWDIKTGSYSIIDTEELREVPPTTGNLHNERFWNPACLMVSALRKDFFIPLSLAKSVRVLTNSNVPSGESLKVLWSPAQDVAIVL